MIEAIVTALALIAVLILAAFAVSTILEILEDLQRSKK